MNLFTSPTFSPVFGTLFVGSCVLLTIGLIALFAHRAIPEDYVRNVRAANKNGLTYLPPDEPKGWDGSPRDITDRDLQKSGKL
jgi:hypothetical protein